MPGGRTRPPSHSCVFSSRKERAGLVQTTIATPARSCADMQDPPVADDCFRDPDTYQCRTMTGRCNSRRRTL
jgi:hypothetical protein